MTKQHPFTSWTNAIIQRHLDELEETMFLDKTISVNQFDRNGYRLRGDERVLYSLNSEYYEISEEHLLKQGRRLYLEGEELPKKWKKAPKTKVDKKKKEKEDVLAKKKKFLVKQIFGYLESDEESLGVEEIVKQTKQCLKEERILLGDLSRLSVSPNSDCGLLNNLIYVTIIQYIFIYCYFFIRH